METGSSTGHVINGAVGSVVLQAIATIQFRMALISVSRGWTCEVHQPLLAATHSGTPVVLLGNGAEMSAYAQKPQDKLGDDHELHHYQLVAYNLGQFSRRYFMTHLDVRFVTTESLFRQVCICFVVCGFLTTALPLPWVVCCVPHTGRNLPVAEWGVVHVCACHVWYVSWAGRILPMHSLHPAPLMQLPRYITYDAPEVDVVPVQVAGWLLCGRWTCMTCRTRSNSGCCSAAAPLCWPMSCRCSGCPSAQLSWSTTAHLLCVARQMQSRRASCSKTRRSR